MLLIEIITVTALLVSAGISPQWYVGAAARCKPAFCQIARRPLLSVLLIGLLSLFFRLSVMPILPIPEPGVPDEYGHLLAADTFAHGRLSNQAHPMSAHFQNLAEIQHPTYASKYPPAQGAMLAFGQTITGDPFWGVWLSVGIMCAAICWMLQAWLAPEWALLGGLITVARIATFSYWADSYWGGAVAATGGALVLGALPRIRTRPSAFHAVVMASGIAILVNSRPFEGLILTVLVIASLVLWTAKASRLELAMIMKKVAVPLCTALIFAGLLTAYYSWRVTGNPFRTPYQVAQADYPTPLFIWGHLQTRNYADDPALRQHFAAWEIKEYHTVRSHLLLSFAIKAIHWWSFFLGVTLTVPFVILSLILPYGFSWKELSWESKFLLFLALTTSLASMSGLYFNPGYAAPATAAIYAVVLKALRRVHTWKVAMANAVISSCFILLPIRAVVPYVHVPVVSAARSWYSTDYQNHDRAKIVGELKKCRGHHLVMVPAYLASEWVANEADIDDAKIVWASQLGGEQDRQLFSYFRDRDVWTLNPSPSGIKIVPAEAK